MTHESLPDAQPRETAGVLILPPLLFALPLVLGWVLERAIALPGLPAIFRPLGLLLLVLSLVPGPWALVVMLRAGVNPEPHVPTRRLVVRGPFRFSRNPIYLTYILFTAGFSLVTNSLWMLMLLIPAIVVAHYGIVLREERYLSRRFGAPYDLYRRRVRRWL